MRHFGLIKTLPYLLIGKIINYIYFGRMRGENISRNSMFLQNNLVLDFTVGNSLSHADQCC